MGTDTAVLTDPPKVLLVDDRKDNLLTLGAVLEPLGLGLINASSGPEALHTLLKEKVSAMILDVQMPGMDGFETAQLVRSRAATRDIPIVFLTAISHDLKCELRGYEVGAIDYICKPFQPDVMRAKIRALIDRAPKTTDPDVATRAPTDAPVPSIEREPRFSEYARIVDLVLPVDTSSVAIARMAVRDALREYEANGEIIETALLCISELVTNAVLHARSGIIVHFDAGPDILRGEVLDGSERPIVRRDPDHLSPAGRGLDLLEQLAARSGWTRYAQGKLVWFELDYRDPNHERVIAP